MLYTTKEIAEIYGGAQKNVTPYMITHTWIPKGLQFIQGKGKGFLFKKEWVEQYIEQQIQRKDIPEKTINAKKGTRKVTNKNFFVH